jgi:hypothetical protein
MKRLVLILGLVFLTASVFAQSDEDRTARQNTQAATIIVASLTLITTICIAPDTIVYPGSLQVGGYSIPYWALDAAAALISLAALNYTVKEVEQDQRDAGKTRLSFEGVPITSF